MGRRSIVLDGYNLMFRDSPPGEASLAASREAFLRRIDAARAPDEDVTIVFDGRAVAGSTGPHPQGLKVIFSRSPRTADDTIVDIVSGSPRGQVIVLTRDRELAHRVKCAGGRLGDPEAFFRRADLPRRPSPRPGRKPPPPRGAELDLWERLFEERDPGP